MRSRTVAQGSHLCYMAEVPRWLPMLVALALLSASVSIACNSANLVGLESVVKKQVVDRVSFGGRTAIDVLWVIDNSGSMCQEQSNLAQNFSAFLDKLSTVDADIQMAVITTDVEDPDQSGRFQHAPAKDFSTCSQSDPRYGKYCLADQDCGEGACLCGIPHIQRCEQDSDCAEREACVRSAAPSQVRFCSVPCQRQSDCGRRFTDPAAFVCDVPAAGGTGIKYCLLQGCSLDAPACGDGFTCVASGIPGDQQAAYCRRFEDRQITCVAGSQECPLNLQCDDRRCPHYGECPAPTCDCPLPEDLDNVIRFRSGVDGDSVEELTKSFRCLATVGTGGASIERGLDAIHRALSPAFISDDHPGFPRAEAHLVVIILSDEDDCTGDEVFGAGGAASGPQAEACQEQGNLQCVWCRDEPRDVRSEADFVKRIKADQNPDAEVLVAVIVGDSNAESVLPGNAPRPSCTSKNGIAYAGNRYTRFAAEFGKGAVVESICQESFEGPLERIASLVSSLNDRFCLSEPLVGCSPDEDCGSGRTCAYFWGESGQCESSMGGQCTQDIDCPESIACDARMICLDSPGHPSGLRIRVRASDSAHWMSIPAASWSFVPTRRYGCLTFSGSGEPSADEEVDIEYISEMRFTGSGPREGSR